MSLIFLSFFAVLVFVEIFLLAISRSYFVKNENLVGKSFFQILFLMRRDKRFVADLLIVIHTILICLAIYVFFFDM